MTKPPDNNPHKMRLFKRILKIFLLIIFVAIVGGYLYLKYIFFVPAPNQLVIQTKNLYIPFKWESDIRNKEVNPYAAMLLPVRLKGCSKTFYMQFDLGASSSMFYKNKLDAINQKFKNIPIESKNGKDLLMNYSFFLDDLKITAKKINVYQYDDTGIDWADTTTNEVIGTIGSDLIDNSILVIDYPGNKIFIGDKIPDNLSARTMFTKFKFVNRKIFLPTAIGKNKTDIFFDTGSSTYELLTTKYSWKELANKGAKVFTNEANSWGKKEIFYTTSTDQRLKFGDVSFPIKNVTYSNGTSYIQRIFMPIFLKIIDVGGLTGNKLFLNKIIIIDTKNLNFGIVN